MFWIDKGTYGEFQYNGMGKPVTFNVHGPVKRYHKYYDELPAYAGKLLSDPRYGFSVPGPEVTVAARTRNRNANGSAMTAADIQRAEAYAKAHGTSARDSNGRVMSPEEQMVVNNVQRRPGYEGVNDFMLGIVTAPMGILGEAASFAKSVYEQHKNESENITDWINPFYPVYRAGKWVYDRLSSDE